MFFCLFGLRSLSGVLRSDPKPVSDYAVEADKSVREKIQDNQSKKTLINFIIIALH